MERVNAGQVDLAISRLPLQSNASVEQVLANALRLKLTVLVEACREELRSRGSLILTAADVGQIAKIEARVLNMTLRDVIEIAFREVPPKEEEVLILRWIASHPGTSYTELLKVYGRNDLSLVIGHLVYHRFGYFRSFLRSNTQSDLLLERQNKQTGVCYTLRPEAVDGLFALGVIDSCHQLAE